MKDNKKFFRNNIQSYMDALSNGQDVVNICAILASYAQLSGLYDNIGSETVESRIAFLDKIGFATYNFEYTYTEGNKQRINTARIKSKEDFIDTMKRLTSNETHGTMSGQLHGLKRTMSEKIGQFVLSQAPDAESGKISAEDAFAVDFTNAILDRAGEDEIVQLVDEYAAKGVDTNRVLNNLEQAKTFGNVPYTSYLKAKEPQNVVNPPKEKRTFRDIVRNLFPKKERATERATEIDIAKVARFIATQQVLAGYANATEGVNDNDYVKLNFVMDEYSLATVDGIKRGAPRVDGVDYASLVSGAMSRVREIQLKISNNTPYHIAINHYIDALGHHETLSEDDKKVLRENSVLSELATQILVNKDRLNAKLGNAITAYASAPSEPAPAAEEGNPTAPKKEPTIWSKARERLKGLISAEAEKPEETEEKKSRFAQWREKYKQTQIDNKKNRIVALLIDTTALTTLIEDAKTANDTNAEQYYTKLRDKVNKSIKKYDTELVNSVNSEFKADDHKTQIEERKSFYQEGYEYKPNKTKEMVETYLSLKAINEFISSDPASSETKKTAFADALEFYNGREASYKGSKEYEQVKKDCDADKYKSDYEDIKKHIEQDYATYLANSKGTPTPTKSTTPPVTEPKKEKKGHVKESHKEKLRKAREAFSLNEYVKDDGIISEYLNRITDTNVKDMYNTAKPYLLELAKIDDNLKETNHNNLKNLFMNLKSVLALIPSKDVVEQIEDFAPVDAILSGIKLECDKLQAESVLDSADKQKPVVSDKGILERVSAIRQGLESKSKNYKALLDKAFEGIDLNKDDVDTKKILKKKFGITEKTADTDIVLKIQARVEKVSKKDEFLSVYLDDFKKDSTLYYNDLKKDEPRMSKEDFVSEYAKILVSTQLIAPKLEDTLKMPGVTIMNQVKDKMYRSIDLPNRELLAAIPKNLEEMIEGNTGIKDTNALFIQNIEDHGIVGIEDVSTIRDNNAPGGIAFAKLPPDMKKAIEDTVRAIVTKEHEAWLGVTQENLLSKLGIGAPVKAADLTGSMVSEWDDLDRFISEDKARADIVAEYSKMYTTAIRDGSDLFGFIDSIESGAFGDTLKATLDSKATKDEKKASIVATLVEAFEKDPTKVEALLADGAASVDKIPEDETAKKKLFTELATKMADSYVSTYVTKKTYEGVIADAKNAGKKVPTEPATPTDKYAITRAIKDTIYEIENTENLPEDKRKELQETLDKLYVEYAKTLIKQKKSGTPLSEADTKFLLTPEGKRARLEIRRQSEKEDPALDEVEEEIGDKTTKEDAENIQPSETVGMVAATYDTVKKAYQDLVALDEKSRPDNYENELKNTATQYMKAVVAKMISGEIVPEDDIKFVNTNIDLFPDACNSFSSTDVKLLCKNILDKYSNKFPNIEIDVDDSQNKNDPKYTMFVKGVKTYEELFPSTDISQKISKIVKDLKDAYVYLKPGIKMCDKLIDYIKTLRFETKTAVVGNDGPSSEGGENGGGKGKGKGDGGSDGPSDDGGNKTNDADEKKLLALISEIKDALERYGKLLEKLVKNMQDQTMMKQAGESAKDVWQKLQEAYTMIQGGASNPNVAKHRPEVDQLWGLYLQMASTIQGQLPYGLTPSGIPGVYCISQEQFALLAATNANMFGATYIKLNEMSPLFTEPRSMEVTAVVKADGVSYRVTLDVKLPSEKKGEVNAYSTLISSAISKFVEKEKNVDMVDIHRYITELFNTTDITDKFYGFALGADVQIENLSEKSKLNTDKAVVKPNKSNEAEHVADADAPTSASNATTKAVFEIVSEEAGLYQVVVGNTVIMKLDASEADNFGKYRPTIEAKVNSADVSTQEGITKLKSELEDIVQKYRQAKAAESDMDIVG